VLKMLRTLFLTEDDSVFKKCIQSVKEAFWPRNFFNPETFKVAFGDVPPDQEKIKKWLDKIIEESSKNELYRFHDKSKNDEAGCALPFLDRYHRFFLQRKWDLDLRKKESIDLIEDIFQLEQPEQKKQTDRYRNYSINVGNYNHFVNVVAVSARLINLFSEKETVSRILGGSQDTGEKKASAGNSDLLSSLEYNQRQFLRTFNLMLAAFFHDLGKTIVDRRHALEGSIILTDHSTTSWYTLRKIAKIYDSENEFEREDFLFIAELLLYHDLFGTLSTGESSYMKLVNLLDGIKRYCYKYIPAGEASKSKLEQQRIWARRHLFDLWVLNVADIMVSIESELDASPSKAEAGQHRKWVDQEYWWGSKRNAEEEINKFFTDNQKSRPLVHDLRIALKLLHPHTLNKHSDNLSDIEREASAFTQRHTTERIERLVRESLTKILDEDAYLKGHSSFADDIGCFLRAIKDFLKNPFKLNQVVTNSIDTSGNFQEFCVRLANIGHMDYSLGFFTKIASRALKRVCVEQGAEPPTEFRSIDKEITNTFWIRPAYEGDLGADQEAKEALISTQASFFIGNYTATIVQILAHLIFREKTINSSRNLEFSDASKRLTGDKIDAIISMKGPNRSKRSIQIALQTIFYW
jgi:hypothetical protein